MSERPTHVVILDKAHFFANDAPLGAAYREEESQWNWWMRCPQCGYRAPLDHEVTLNDDDTLTISPSLVCPNNGPGNPTQCTAHYFVNRSILSGEW